MGETNKKRPYCKPWNAGLASETPAVCRRLGRLFDALETEINTNIADGQIVEDVRQFRSQLQKQLLAEGWSMSYLGGNKMRVRPPGHKKPYGPEANQTQPTEAQAYTPPDHNSAQADSRPIFMIDEGANNATIFECGDAEHKTYEVTLWMDGDVRFLIDNPRRTLWEFGRKASEHLEHCRSPSPEYTLFAEQSYQQSVIATISVIHAAEDVLFCLEQGRQPTEILGDYTGNGVIIWVSPTGERHEVRKAERTSQPNSQQRADQTKHDTAERGDQQEVDQGQEEELKSYVVQKSETWTFTNTVEVEATNRHDAEYLAGGAFEVAEIGWENGHRIDINTVALTEDNAPLPQQSLTNASVETVREERSEQQSPLGAEGPQTRSLPAPERHHARKAEPTPQTNPHESKKRAEATTVTDQDEKQTLNTERAESMSEQQPKTKNTYTVYAWCVRPFRAYAEVEAETPEEAIVTARGLHDELLDTAEACSHKDYPWDEFAAENEQGDELLRVLDHEAKSETTGATPETVSGRSLSNTNTEREGESMSEQQAKQTQSTEQQESGKQQPLHKETHGAVQVMVWDNGPNREPTVSFGRPYRGPQGYRVAHSYRAKHLSDLMKATAAAALALGRELEHRPQSSGKAKPEKICSIDSGRFTAALAARWNATTETYTYAAKILCDGKQVFAPMLDAELAGLQVIAQAEGLPWLADKVAKRHLPEPGQKDFQHFEKALRASLALMGRFNDRHHKEVLADRKVVEELGLDLSAVPEQEHETTQDRSR